MTATQHTAGPWEAVDCLTGAISINASPKVPIATVGGSGWHLGERTARANARLIAITPHLLQLLIEVTDRIDDLKAGNPNAAEDLAAWSDDAREAIAKATRP